MKYNLIFDCNYLLYKNVFSLNKMKMLYGSLYDSLTNNINKYIDEFNFNNIFLVSDSNKKSLRKKIYSEYKDKRVKQDDVDWEYVFEEFNRLLSDMEKQYTVLTEDNVEGDDLICSLIYRSNKKNYSNVVISSDNDLNQLCKYDINKKTYINIFINDHNNSEKIKLPIGLEIYIKHFEDNYIDMFSLDKNRDLLEFFNKFKNRFEIVEINNKNSLLIKLIMGDKSDNIFSIYQTLTKSGKLQGIGESGAKKICEFYNTHFDINININTDDDTFKNNIIQCIELYKKIKLSDLEILDIKNKLELNIKLIELHYKHYPEDILEKIINKL